MLRSISDGRLQSPLILFVDNGPELYPGKQYGPFSSLVDEDSDSSSMFLSVIKSYVKGSERATHVLCWQRKTSQHLETLQKQFPSKLILHDCLSDFNGWIDQGRHQSHLFSIIDNSISEDTREINIVIDSLSNPLFTIGFGSCIQDLQKIVNFGSINGIKVHQLLCLVNANLVPFGPASILHLKHIASTVVELKCHVASITHRKPGGHIEKKEEKYAILSEGEISIEPLRASALTEIRHTEEKPSTLPQDVASFRVGLSDKEKEDRSKLVLPYMRTSDTPQEIEDGGGKVFYQPDAVDDWDDEDPDDDLDI
ncbi:elongator complex protein 5 [Thrips palmi]|uniref:Elongator complex protein 5 n=1 Tax=Thrips palmi TaxID=161013 RepID=A0A6P8YFE6_THRPL|nr:elongator complex protein 5 [Thrips palmi]